MNFYKKAIALRKNTPALVYGVFKSMELAKEPVYCYYREYNGELYYIELNLGKKLEKRPCDVSNFDLLLSTRGGTCDMLRPFEGNLYKIK